MPFSGQIDPLIPAAADGRHTPLHDATLTMKKLLFLVLLMVCTSVLAGSLRSTDNGANQYEHARLLAIPTGFGQAEFTLELWIRPDNRSAYPAGPCGAGGSVRYNWCTENVPRYSVNCWWCNGNFLLDGVDFANPPDGGHIALQFYDGGRLRWLLGDGNTAATLDGFWSIGNGPNANNPRLLDGRWHHVALVRRFVGASSSALELWIDGVLVDTETSNRRTNLWAIWSQYATPGDQYTGWFWMAEKQAALGTVGQLEDYKGLMDEVRFWNRAKSASELSTQWRNAVTGSEAGLSGWFDFSSAAGNSVCDRLSGTRCMTLFNTNPANNIVSTETAPLNGGGGASAPSITSANTATFTIGLPGTFTVTATGNPAPILSASGALPNGVTFTNTTGVLAGTPALGTAGSYNISINASNSQGSAVQAFTLVVAKANQVISFSLPLTAPQGSSVSLAATSSSGLAVSYGVASTPATAVCVVSGASLQLNGPGTCNVTARQAGDASYNAATPVTLTVTVTALPTLDPPGDEDGDGIPNGIEPTLGLNPRLKDNDIFANTAFGRRLFVMQQYRDFLRREASTAEIAAGESALAAGQTRQAFIDSMLSNPAFADLSGPVTRLYQAYFLRLPESGGYNFWLDAYQARNPWIFIAISNFFARSPEFVQRYGTLTNEQFVTLIYNNILQRAPEPSGFVFWTEELNSGRRSAGQVMADFSESPENKLKTKGLTQVVTLNLNLLKQEVDVSMLAEWEPRLNRGDSAQPLIVQLLATPAYRARFLP